MKLSEKLNEIINHYARESANAWAETTPATNAEEAIEMVEKGGGDNWNISVIAGMLEEAGEDADEADEDSLMEIRDIVISREQNFLREIM